MDRRLPSDESSLVEPSFFEIPSNPPVESWPTFTGISSRDSTDPDSIIATPSTFAGRRMMPHDKSPCNVSQPALPQILLCLNFWLIMITLGVLITPFLVYSSTIPLMVLFFNHLVIGVFAWSFIGFIYLLVFSTLANDFNFRPSTRWFTTIFVVLLAILACALLISTLLLFGPQDYPIDTEKFKTGACGASGIGFGLPSMGVYHTARGCDSRVETQRSILFKEEIYLAQFPSTFAAPGRNRTICSRFDIEGFEAVRGNATLCSQGFQGNEDLYGMGIRVGIYLQWVVSLISNQLLPIISRKWMQKAYLIFAVSLCIATYASSFVPCTFGTEIEVLYWLYWGGVVCVYGSSPSQVRLGDKPRWVGLDWSTAIQYVTHALMTYHGIWFFWYAHSHVFARWPCGTYKFFLAPILEPSVTSRYLRQFLMIMGGPVFLPTMFTFPVIVGLFAAEIKQSIQDSALFPQFFRQCTIPGHERLGSGLASTDIRKPSFGLRYLLRLYRLYTSIRRYYKLLRSWSGFPSDTMGGIRLITPVDVAHRRKYRIACASMGLMSLTVSIWAIEATLKWNKVMDVYSIASTGQYIAFSIGVGTLVSVLWELVKQEAERRRVLGRRRAIGDDMELDELHDVPSTLAAAFRHAAYQPDAGFWEASQETLPSFSSQFDLRSEITGQETGVLDSTPIFSIDSVD